MRRAIAWAAFVLALVLAYRFAMAWRNPWLASQVAPASEALHIPGCADKPGCVP